MIRFGGRVAIVTGARPGLGGAHAVALAARAKDLRRGVRAQRLHNAFAQTLSSATRAAACARAFTPLGPIGTL